MHSGSAIMPGTLRVFCLVSDYDAAGKVGRMRKPPWIMLAGLLVAIGPPAVRADTAKLDVSGNLVFANGFASCSGSGCTLGGDIVINNTTGDIISEHITMSGETPTVGPFTQTINGVSESGGLTRLDIPYAESNALFLLFSAPTAGSSVGHNGGAVSDFTVLIAFGSPAAFSPIRVLSGGGPAFTPSVTPTPEPSSVALMLLGVGLMFVMRKRIGQDLPQAS
jgi:hypothetical protein